MILEHDIQHIVKLSQNENPFGLSPMAIKAIADSYHSAHRYPAFIPADLKEKLAIKHGLSSDNIVIGAGSVEIIDLIIKSLTNVDEEIVVSENSFMAYYLLSRNNKRTCRIAKMDEYTISLDNITNLCNEKTKVVFIANPNNPTGTIVTHKALDHFISQIPSHIHVVIDEAYIEYVNDLSYPDTFELRKKYPNLVIIHTFSKLYGLAGLRIGYSIASKEISDAIEGHRTPFSVTSIAVAAAMASLDDYEFLEECVAINEEEREFVYSELKNLGFNVVPSQGNFIYIECVNAKEKQAIFNLFKDEGFLIRTLEPFGMEKGLRISIGIPEDNKRLIECLRQF